jgi:dTDP-4-amino-4,6-dideoxygalactose transaminase
MAIKVSRYNYSAQFDDVDRLIADLRAALVAGDYILGETVQRFEEELTSFLGCQYAVGVNSGTDALIIGLQALNIGPGDEVVTVANTFHATALAVVRSGANLRLVDCRPDDYSMDLDQLEDLVTEKTRAIIAVHLFGRVLDIERVVSIASRVGARVVEDCAQAIGGITPGGARVGTVGDIGCFSFHPSKNLAAAGDAGALVCNDPETAEHARCLRNLGQVVQNRHEKIGMNSKLDALQALVLRHKLGRVDRDNRSRRKVAETYGSFLADWTVPHPQVTPSTDHVFHLYPIEVGERDRVISALRAAEVDAVVRYPVPIHQQTAFRSRLSSGHFPHSEHQAANTLCLPMRPDLSPREIDHVLSVLADAIGLRRTSKELIP